MLSSRIFWKLYATFVALVLVSAITSLVLVERSVEKDERAQIQSALSSKLALLQEIAANVLEQRDFTALRTRLSTLGRDAGARLTVIDADGTVIADSEERAERMDNHLKRPEIQEALRTGGEGQAVRPSSTMRTTFVYRARSVRSPTDQLLGFVRASMPETQLEERLHRVRGLVLVGGGALPGPALDALGTLPVRLARAHGPTNEPLVRVMDYVARKQNADDWRGDVAWLSDASPPWCLALPLHARDVEAFARTLFTK